MHSGSKPQQNCTLLPFFPFLYTSSFAYAELGCCLSTVPTLNQEVRTFRPLTYPHQHHMCVAAGPANGFVETYLAQCNLLGIESNREIVQFICDLDAKRITDLNLDLCPGMPMSMFRLAPPPNLSIV